jgi:UDP-4-amino-4,6-dideoxy-N-acetyl-beta-L-altrosamine N-acetyltransferase
MFNIENKYSFKNFVELNNVEMELVLNWRNHEKIREMMYNSNIIKHEDHIKFINNLKENSTKKYWLVSRNLNYIGVFSLINIENFIGELGFYLAPEFHKIYGIEFYFNILSFVFEVIKFEKIYGFTLVDNKSANSLNDFFGFTNEEMIKEIDKDAIKMYRRELTNIQWSESIKCNPKIERLLKITDNR